MAIEKITNKICDVCKKTVNDFAFDRCTDVIFTTEQTEGRGVDNYLSQENIQLCKKCTDHLLKGNYIFGHGAMGYNTYRFRSES